MAQVKVRNLDHREYTEMFRDVLITIPAGGCVEMGRSEALQFLSQGTPLNLDGSGRCIKPKMLKIEQDPEVFAAHRDQPFRFTAPDGTEFRTQEGHDMYMAKLHNEVKVDVKEPIRRRKAPIEKQEAASS